MSILPLPNNIRHGVSSNPGTGAITLGGPVPGFQSLSNSSDTPASGQVVPYIVNDSGSVWEFGYGTLTLSGSTWTLNRTQIKESSAGIGTAANLSSAALVSITILAADIGGLSEGYVNKFRNPGMDIAQRGTSGTIAASGFGYTLDGWALAPTGAACSWAQEWCANIRGNALRLNAASGLTSLILLHRIESYLAAQLLSAALTGQSVTVQFRIYNGTGAAITPQLSTAYASARDNFGTVTSDLGTPNLQSIPAGVQAVVAYTFVPSASCTNGYQVDLYFGGALNASSGYVDISMADIRVNLGMPTGLCSAPPRVELRNVQTEMAFCQRYFYSTYGNGVAPGTTSSDGSAILIWTGPTADPTTYIGIQVFFPTMMRFSSSNTIYNSHTGATGSAWSQNASTSLSTTIGVSSMVSCFVALNDQSVQARDFIKFHLTASAEL